jgi:hypothetical protein
MNVPDYLKELLLQNSEVSVPGLGAFSMVRKNATYNEKEGKFYPPYHQVKFNPHLKDDNAFVKYLAYKKNILFETASYIVEKFVSGLLEQASKENTAFADIGWFSNDNNELIFKPNDKLVIDPSFYGYAPISLEKLHTEKPKPVYGAPEPSVARTQEEPAELVQPDIEDDEDDEIEQPQRVRTRVSGWFVFLMVFISGAIILFCSYLIFPAFADRLKTAYQVMVHNKTGDRLVSKKKIIPILGRKTEGSTDTAPAFKESVETHHFEVVVDLAKNLPAARAEVRRLENLGIDAEILTNVPGVYLNVSIFSSNNYGAADSVLQLMLKTGKISKKSHIIIL